MRASSPCIAGIATKRAAGCSSPCRCTRTSIRIRRMTHADSCARWTNTLERSTFTVDRRGLGRPHRVHRTYEEARIACARCACAMIRSLQARRPEGRSTSFALAMLLFAMPAAAHPTIDIVAANWHFTPSTITVEAGETTTLRLTSTSGTHGIASDELGIAATTITQGRFVEVSFTPRVAGTFAVHCSIYCGAGHPDMVLTVVVKSAAARLLRRRRSPYRPWPPTRPTDGQPTPARRRPSPRSTIVTSSS